MPVTMKGLVYYPDDPHKRVFRTIYPVHDDKELDEAPIDSDGKIMMNGAKPHDWTSFNTDNARKPVMIKVPRDDAVQRNTGTPWTSKDEPLIYFVNCDELFAKFAGGGQTPLPVITEFSNWLDVNPAWSSNRINLGSTKNVTALTAKLIAPCWIVIADTSGVPTIGKLARQLNLLGHTLALWIA